MIVRGAFSLLRRRAAQTRRGLALLVEAEVVQLPLERREPVVPEVDAQSRLQALPVVDDDAAVRVPGQDLALLLEHLVELDHEVVRRDAAQLLGEGGAGRGGAGRGRRLGHGLGGACAGGRVSSGYFRVSARTRRRGRGVEGGSAGRRARRRRLQGSERGLRRAARARGAGKCFAKFGRCAALAPAPRGRVEPLFFCWRPAEGCSECVKTS